LRNQKADLEKKQEKDKIFQVLMNMNRNIKTVEDEQKNCVDLGS
jgi:hypothetical protein